MTDMNAQDSTSARGWQSVRTILEALILGGILWLVRSTSAQSEAIVRLQTQLEGMQRDNSALSQQLATLPALAREVDRLSLREDDHERRITDIERLRKLQ